MTPIWPNYGCLIVDSLNKADDFRWGVALGGGRVPLSFP